MFRWIWRQYKRRILIIGVILFFFLLLFLQTQTTEIGEGVTQVVQVVAYPFQASYKAVQDVTSNTWKRYVWLMQVEQENEDLHSKVARLQEQVLQLQEKSLAYDRFQKFLNFSVPQVQEKVFAKIIGQIHRRHSDLLIVNKGTRDGVQKNYAVVSPEGIVGKIYRAGMFQSQILVITDPSFVVSATLQKTRTHILVKGSYSKKLIAQQFPYETKVNEGDIVISTGLAGIFPAGLFLGTVRKFVKKPFGLFQSLEIKPAVSLDQLEEVTIILKKQTQYQPLFSAPRQ